MSDAERDLRPGDWVQMTGLSGHPEGILHTCQRATAEGMYCVWLFDGRKAHAKAYMLHWLPSSKDNGMHPTAAATVSEVAAGISAHSNLKCGRCLHTESEHGLSFQGCEECSCTEFDPSPAEVIRKYTKLDEILGELAGFASMCWDPRPSTAVFDSQAASEAVGRAVVQVEKYFASREVTKKPSEVCHECGMPITLYAAHDEWEHADLGSFDHTAARVRPQPPLGTPVYWRGNWWRNSTRESWYASGNLDNVQWKHMIGAWVPEAPDAQH